MRISGEPHPCCFVFVVPFLYYVCFKDVRWILPVLSPQPADEPLPPLEHSIAISDDEEEEEAPPVATVEQPPTPPPPEPKGGYAIVLTIYLGDKILQPSDTQPICICVGPADQIIVHL